MKIQSLLLILVCVSWAHAASSEQKQPNIVVIIADDLGYADVVFNPQHPREVATPHLGALAKESVICRQGYVSGHVCSPTRAGLMTGRYQQRLGLYTGGEAGSGLPMSEQIFPQFLKPAGYATAQFGKWHLGPDPEWSPAHRGFDQVFGFLGRGAHDYFKLDDPKDPIYRGTNVVKETGYLTDRLGDETVDFITRVKGKPFFAYLAFNAVHAPLQAPADEIAKFDTGDKDRDILLAMGKRMDDAIGKIVSALKQTGAWENTLLFFVGDNGGPLAQTANNTPLRAGKHSDYEGGIRVPFLVCWPERLAPGESQAVVSSLDILATALAAADISAPESKPFDGINLLPVLRKESAPSPRDLFWCAGAEEGWWAVRSGDWKLVCDKQRIGLFDLREDVSESKDLSKQMPEKVAELTALHDAWLSEMANPIKGGGKRYGMEAASKKKAKDEKKKPKTSKSRTEVSASGISGTVREVFATLPAKPWKSPRGNWESNDGALWGSQRPGDKQDAKLTGPAAFRGGVLQFEFNLPSGSQLALRFKDPDGETLISTEITMNSVTVVKLTEKQNPILHTVLNKLASDTWHTLTLKFDGPELCGEFENETVIATDEVFDRDKSEIDFLVSGGPVGIRNFSMTPAASQNQPHKN